MKNDFSSFSNNGFHLANSPFWISGIMSLCQTVDKFGVILHFEVFLSYQACFVAIFTAWSCVTLDFLIEA